MEVTADIVNHLLLAPWKIDTRVVRPTRRAPSSSTRENNYCVRLTTSSEQQSNRAERYVFPLKVMFAAKVSNCQLQHAYFRRPVQISRSDSSAFSWLCPQFRSRICIVCGGLYAFAFYKEAVSCCLWVGMQMLDSSETQVKHEASQT